MRIHHKHPWNISTTEALRLQNQLRNHVNLINHLQLSSIRTVAAADISYSRGSSKLTAAVVMVNFSDLSIKKTHFASQEVRFPYIPGFLSFREIPVLMSIFEKITDYIDVILCDGQGIAHPRRFGLACHLGVLLDIPALGCAKSRLIGEHQAPGNRKGAYSGLYDGGEPIGVVLRTRPGVKPLYVSPGHKIDIDTAREIALACVSRYRIPDPLRFAHQEVNRYRKEHENQETLA